MCTPTLRAAAAHEPEPAADDGGDASAPMCAAAAPAGGDNRSSGTLSFTTTAEASLCPRGRRSWLMVVFLLFLEHFSVGVPTAGLELSASMISLRARSDRT